jgi:hypothetical protein
MSLCYDAFMPLEFTIRIQLAENVDLQVARDELASLGAKECVRKLIELTNESCFSGTIDPKSELKSKFKNVANDSYDRWTNIGDQLGTTDAIQIIKETTNEEIEKLEDTICQQKETILSLGNSLLKYGGHTKHCQSIVKPNQYFHQCTCGYRDGVKAFRQYSSEDFDKTQGISETEKEKLVQEAKMLLSLLPEEWSYSDPHTLTCTGCSADGCFGHPNGGFEVDGIAFTEDGLVKEEVAQFVVFARNKLPKFIRLLENV